MELNKKNMKNLILRSILPYEAVFSVLLSAHKSKKSLENKFQD